MPAFNSRHWERKAGRATWIWSQANSVKPCLKTTIITEIQTNRQNQLSNFYHSPQWQLKHCSSQIYTSYFPKNRAGNQGHSPHIFITHRHSISIYYTLLRKQSLHTVNITLTEEIGQENQTRRTLSRRVECEESPKDAEKLHGKYIHEVSEPRDSIQMNRNHFI